MHKKLAVVVAIALVATGSVAAMAARRSSSSPGSISLSSAHAVRGDKATMTWSWKPGTIVHSTSRVDILRSAGNTWTYFMTNRPITDAGVQWNTTTLNDGGYVFQAIVRKTTIHSNSAGVIVDNLAPGVHIDQPTAGQIIVDDQQPVPAYAVLAGTSTIVGDAFDLGSGIASVSWKLDETQIATTASAQYDFGQVTPGLHTLSFTATDGAGNASDPVTVDIVTVPGPSDATNIDPNHLPVDPNNPPVDPNNPPDPTSLIPGDLPVPDGVPSGLPVDPNNLPVNPQNLIPTDPPVNPSDLPVDPNNPPVNPNNLPVSPPSVP